MAKLSLELIAGKKVWVFPGQGSQALGMGEEHDLFSLPGAKEILDAVQEESELDVKKLCLEGPKEVLNQTENAQMAILAVGLLGLLHLEDQGFSPEVVIGHSLGEIIALVAAGVLSPKDAIKIVTARGKAMKEAGEENPGGMAVIRGATLETVEKLCKRSSDGDGKVVVANVNCLTPGKEQIIISGHKKSIERAQAFAEEFKIRKKIIILAVSVAAHSQLMKDAEPAMRKVLDEVNFNPVHEGITFVSSTSAKSETDPEVIKRLLLVQLTEGVLWHHAIDFIVNDIGYKSFLEVGAKRAMTGLIKKIIFDDPDLEAHALEP